VGDGARAVARGRQVEAIRVANDSLLRSVERERRDARDTAGMRGIIVVIALCAFFALLNWAFFVRNERRQARERDRQLAFAERLQTARSEEAARAMLARHLEVVAPGTLAIVTDADDRSVAGRPVTARGERIATVILRSDRDLGEATERLVHDSILRAAPVLATLQTLALAEVRAATDPLTGLGNRRLVEDALARVAARANRTGETFALAVIDLDRFKAVNDTYGHAAGDALLVAIARALVDATRADDIVGRQGGDEFVVVLADVDVTEAVTVIERCRQAIAATALGATGIHTTASLGLATSNPDGPAEPETLARAADEAVYAAKAQGGDCVVVAPTRPPMVQASALRA
jgi:diguanylate cyclase (GGDEF)-like protein